ncbi:hypothetical protein ACFPRL_14045 [Pseudoclavibacter helvolus]
MTRSTSQPKRRGTSSVDEDPPSRSRTTAKIRGRDARSRSATARAVSRPVAMGRMAGADAGVAPVVFCVICVSAPRRRSWWW